MTNPRIVKYRIREIKPHVTSWGQKIARHYEAEAAAEHFFYGADEEAKARDGIEQYIRSIGAIPKDDGEAAS